MQAKFGNQAKTQLIKGPAGNLEIRFHKSLPAGENCSASQKLMVLSHPHPLYGGAMNNKVITTLEKAAQNLGFSTLAYNFRGVGKSEGEHDHTIGELDDLLAVAEWGKAQFSDVELHLAGFSFGSFISLKALPALQPKSLLTVAPPVGIYDFRVLDFSKMDASFKWSLVQGGQDEVVDAQQILEWSRSLEQKPDCYWRENASHFFHGELIWLRKVVNLVYG